MKRIITTGSLMRDCFLHTKYSETLYLQTSDKKLSFIILQEGKKIELTSVEYAVGGGAANSAVSFSRLGHDVAICGVVGSDQDGSWIIEQLQKKSIDTSKILTSSQGQTGTSYILPCPSGNRAILAARGVNSQITSALFTEELYKKNDLLYIASLNGAAAKQFVSIIQKAKQYELFVASNPGSQQINEHPHEVIAGIGHIDLLIVNAYEAQQLMKHIQQDDTKDTGKEYRAHMQISSGKKKIPTLLCTPISPVGECFILPLFFKTVMDMGPQIVVVTNGAEGVYVAHKDKIYFHPSIPAEVISTVGAGDAFGSAFVSTYIETDDIVKSIQAGCVNSCAIVQHLDAQTGLLDASSIEKCIALVDPTLVQVFDL